MNVRHWSGNSRTWLAKSKCSRLRAGIPFQTARLLRSGSSNRLWRPVRTQPPTPLDLCDPLKHAISPVRLTSPPLGDDSLTLPTAFSVFLSRIFSVFPTRAVFWLRLTETSTFYSTVWLHSTRMSPVRMRAALLLVYTALLSGESDKRPLWGSCHITTVGRHKLLSLSRHFLRNFLRNTFNHTNVREPPVSRCFRVLVVITYSIEIYLLFKTFRLHHLHLFWFFIH